MREHGISKPFGGFAIKELSHKCVSNQTWYSEGMKYLAIGMKKVIKSSNLDTNPPGSISIRFHVTTVTLYIAALYFSVTWMVKYSTGWRPPIILYAAVNYKQGCGGCIWPNSCLLCWGVKFLFFRTQKFHFLGVGRSFFRPFHLFKIYWVFLKFTESDPANWS